MHIFQMAIRWKLQAIILKVVTWTISIFFICIQNIFFPCFVRFRISCFVSRPVCLFWWIVWIHEFWNDSKFSGWLSKYTQYHCKHRPIRPKMRKKIGNHGKVTIDSSKSTFQWDSIVEHTCSKFVCTFHTQMLYLYQKCHFIVTDNSSTKLFQCFFFTHHFINISIGYP